MMMRIALICVLVACSHPQPRSPYDELERRTDRVVAAMDRLVASLHAASDCSQMAFALRQFSRYATEIGELDGMRSALPRGERERFDYDHEDDREMLDHVRAAAERCMTDRETHLAYEAAGFMH